MDYTLRRHPDGTVNAQPGDAVEVLDNGEWVSATYSGTAKTSDKVVIEMYLLFEQRDVKRYYDLEHVRHARGGAGWHRLREARLRAVVEALAAEYESSLQGHVKEFHNLIVDAQTALADLDNAEPEA